MTVTLSSNFKEALMESDSTLILGGCTTGTIEPEFYYIWDKEYSTLYLSISFSNNDNYKDSNIYCYFRRKHDSNKNFDANSELAIEITDNNESINKLIEIDLSNIEVGSEIESSLPESLKLVEDFNLDIGSSIFLTEEDDSKKLITKRSFIKLLYLTKTLDSSTDFHFGKTILNKNGETIYRKFKYRNYNKDQFFPKLLNSEFITKENNIDCYNIGDSRTVLRLSGKIGYTDLVIENNKILKEIDGYQDISEILNINVSKKYKDSKNIWEENIPLDRCYNIIVPENKTGRPRKETLILSINFIDHENNLVTLSQDIKINQTKEYNDNKPWYINYDNFQNIKVEYETENGKNIPVVIFQEPSEKDESTNLDLTSRIKLTCHSEMLEQISKKDISITYEYLSEEFSCDEDAESVFSNFFDIKKKDLELDLETGEGEIILDITAKSILKRDGVVLSDKLWYPYAMDKSVAIKYILSIDLEGFMGINEYKEEIIFIRQPENIHRYGSLSVIPKDIDIVDYDPEGLSHGEINLTYNIENGIETEIASSREEYIKYCGWVLDKITPIDSISTEEIILNKCNKFTESSDGNLESNPTLRFYYNNYSDYLSRLFNAHENHIVDEKICDVTINGLSYYYFKDINDNNFFNMYSRLFTSKSSIPWQKKVFMTSIKKAITCGINNTLYIEDSLGNFSRTNTVSLNDIGSYSYIHSSNLFPIRFANTRSDIKLYEINPTSNYYRKGSSVFKITRKYLTNSIHNGTLSIFVNNGSESHQIQISLADAEYSGSPNSNSIVLDKNCFRLINDDGTSEIGILSNSSLKIRSNDDITLSNSVEETNLTDLFNFDNYYKEGNDIYLNPIYDNQLNYTYHNIDFIKKDQNSISIENCPICSPSNFYLSTIYVKKIEESSEEIADKIQTLNIININEFVSPKFYDKLGNEFTNMDLLVFDNPEGYSMPRSAKNKFYILSEYPLTNEAISLNLDESTTNTINWESSIGGFSLSSEDYIELNNSLINYDNEDIFVQLLTCDSSNFKNRNLIGGRNILNYFIIKNKTANSSTKIENAVCKNNIFANYKLDDTFDSDYESITNIPINSIIPSAKAVINTHIYGSINNNVPKRNEYVEYNGKNYYIGTEITDNPVIKLDTITERSNLVINFHKWFQSDIDKVCCFGSVCNGFGENSVINSYGKNNIPVLPLYTKNIPGELVPSSKISSGGHLSGISKIPITINLDHFYYDSILPSRHVFDLLNNNYININGSTKKLDEISKHLHLANYNIVIELNNNLLKNSNNETFKYIKIISIPWKGLDNAFLIKIDNSNKILFEKENCLNIDLNNCSWNTTSVSFKILPISIIDGKNDLNSNTFSYNSESTNYEIKLNRELDYYNRFKSIYSTDSGNYAVITNNLPKTIEENTIYNVSDISFEVTLNFPQNTTNRSINREFNLLLNNDLIIPIKITQDSIVNSGTNLVSIVDKTNNISGNQQILLHSSGYCINNSLEIGILRLKSRTSNIYNYFESSVNMYFKKSGSEELLFINNQADIIEELETNEQEKAYYLTISANFPTRYTRPSNSDSEFVGTLLLLDNNRNIIKEFNCFQGYTYTKLIDNNDKEFLVNLENSEYIGKVGSETNPVLYDFSKELPSYRVAFFQRELSYNSFNQSFRNYFEMNEKKVTLGERASTNANYSSITYSESVWNLTGKSKFILKDNYSSDIEYLDSNLENIDINESYPTLIHKFNIDESTNYLINQSEDLINIKLSICMSNHLLTTVSGISNNNVPSSDLINNSPIVYEFWISYCN